MRELLNDFQINLSVAPIWFADSTIPESEKRKKAKAATKAWVAEVAECTRKETLECKQALDAAFSKVYSKHHPQVANELSGKAFG